MMRSAKSRLFGQSFAVLLTFLAIIPVADAAAQSVSFNVTSGGGYIGIVGQNPQKLNFPIKFSDMSITSAVFSQSDADGDGLFNIQGNDIPGQLTLSTTTSTFVIDGAIVWRNNELTGVGFIYKCANAGDSSNSTISIPYNNANVPSSNQTGIGSTTNVNLICNEGTGDDKDTATNIFFGIKTTDIYSLYGYTNISENAAQLSNVLDTFNTSFQASDSFVGSPSIEGVKTSVLTDADSSNGLSAGDTLTYTVTATNTGNVTLTGVTVSSDTLTQADGTASANNLSAFTASGSTTLAPGDSVSFTATYAVAQADIDAGGLSNTATVQGTSPTSANVTDVTDDGDDADGNTVDDPTENTVAASPSIESWKLATLKVDVDGNGKFGAGDTLTYTITVKNTGNVTLTNISVVSDNLSSGSINNLTPIATFGASDFTTTTNPAVLAPGEELDYTADYLITASDQSSGNLFNTATVSGDFNGQTFTDVSHNEEDLDGNATNLNEVTVIGISFEVANDELIAQDRTRPVVISPLNNDAGGNVSKINVSSLQLVDSNGVRSNQMIVPGEGTWDIDNVTGEVTFTPEVGFTGSSVSIDYYIESTDGASLIATISILFIDPRGVVYDDVTFQPISGVQLVFVDQNGTELPDSCFPAGQQPQTTGADGRYQFDLSVACTDADGETFDIKINRAPGYELESTSLARQAGTLDPGVPSTAVFEVVNYDRAPTAADPRQFFTRFLIGTNSRQIVNNHIALVALPSPIDEIKDDLREILRDDLLATMTQQSRQISGYSGSGLKRLKSNRAGSCATAINEELKSSPILFENGSSTILASSEAVLDLIAATLNTCQDDVFEVAGHTDNSADDEYNLKLSKARSEFVLNALIDRGVNRAQLTSNGYGTSRPVASNDTTEGRQRNRRVELLSLKDIDKQNHEDCDAVMHSDNTTSVTANNNGVQAKGSLSGERKNCETNGWHIWDARASYLDTDDGIHQAMFQVALRSERLSDPNHLDGRFIGGYASSNSVSGLADGTINGFGLNGGVYSAHRFDTNLYTDYYLAGALGRHVFSLDFDRAAGEITADGSYYYYGLFSGAALSGETDLEGVSVTPRAGFDLAWSPGGEADYKASRGGLVETGSLSTGEVYGLRIYAEVGFEEQSSEHDASLSVTPKIFCDRTIGSDDSECGAGLRIELEKHNEDGTRFSLEVMGEKTKSMETIGLGLDYRIPFYSGELAAKGSTNQNQRLDLNILYRLGF